MPLPRKPHQKRSANGTRASRRDLRERAWLQAKLVERFTALHTQLVERRKHTYRGAYGAISYLKPGEIIPPGYQKVEYDETGDGTPHTAQEKAPGLSTGGSSSSED
jgi:hypothetical protein